MTSITNLDRLKMEIQGIELNDTEASIYLQENNLDPTANYQADSTVNRRAILSTAYNILNALANNPTLMRQVKSEDMTISSFADHLQSRIDQLDRAIRKLSTNDQTADSSFFMLFSK